MNRIWEHYQKEKSLKEERIEEELMTSLKSHRCLSVQSVVKPKDLTLFVSFVVTMEMERT